MKLLNRVLLWSVAMGFSFSAMAEDEWLRSIPEFELTDQNGVTHTLEQYKDNEFIVMYVQKWDMLYDFF